MKKRGGGVEYLGLSPPQVSGCNFTFLGQGARKMIAVLNSLPLLCRRTVHGLGIMVLALRTMIQRCGGLQRGQHFCKLLVFLHRFSQNVAVMPLGKSVFF